MFTIHNLTFAYPNCSQNVLEDISFTIEEGNFFVLCGLSGCGKTTLLRHLKPSMAPNGIKEGSILYDGMSIEDLESTRAVAEIGYVMQDLDYQFVTDTVLHELAFAMENLGYSNELMHGRIAEIAAYFGLEDILYKSVHQLSGGQKQMVSLAAVMTLYPKVLLLDEPCSQLDPISVTHFLTMLNRIHKELGITIVLIEQSLEEVMGYADRVIMMEGGKLLCNVKKEDGYSYLAQHELRRAMPAATQLAIQLECKDRLLYSVMEGRNLLRNAIEQKELPVSKENFVLPERTESLTPKKSDIATWNHDISICKRVWFRYEKHGKDYVKDISLTCRQGEILGILGGNGAGKTTFLKVIAGIIKPHQGKVLYKDKMGYLPQDGKMLFSKETIRAEFEDSERFREYVSAFDLESVLDQHPYDVSGGQIQRAALIKVLLNEPKLLLLDEPSKGLDIIGKLQLVQILRNLAKKGITICMVSHDLEFTAMVANRCALYHDGSLVNLDHARKFFEKQQFYTTAAARISRGLISDCICTEELLEVIS